MHRPSLTVAAAVLTLAIGSIALGEEPGSLDEQLGLELPAPTAKPAPAPPEGAPPEPGEAIKPGVVKPKPEENFAAAVAEMKEAGDLLAGHDPTLPTQRIQLQVIDRLDMLIADARKKQSQSKSQSQSQQQDTGSKPSAGPPQQGPPSPNGSQPSQQAGAPGSVQNRDGTQPLREEREEWGDLPPRVRDELLQGLDDRFSDLYRGLTERYYKRLAEENP